MATTLLKPWRLRADAHTVFEIDAALHRLVEAQGSDLHLKVGVAPLMRVHGKLGPVPDELPLRPADTERVLDQIVPSEEHRAEFASDGEVDFAYAVPGFGRFRVNAFRQRGTISLVMRSIPSKIKTVDELGLPPVVSDLAEEKRGIILLTGTTGSGKSTTLAAIIDHINRTRAEHIVTIEDPIEFLHKDKSSAINQREVGSDTASFGRALRRVLRQDPDVILIGEMRDEETVHTALSAAETGHLVLSTLHTIDAPETVNRIVDFFPPHQQQQARAMLAGTLKGIISQRLVPTPDKRGRVAVCEILRTTGRAKDMILDPEQTGRLHEVIAEGVFYGMQTFDQALLHHVQAGRVSMEEAMKVATSPHDFKLLVAAEGRVATSMDDVGGGQAEPEPEPREERQPVGVAAEPPAPRPAPVSPPPPAPAPPSGPAPSTAPPGFGS
jgi:twitching motility protein PilT